MIVLTQFLTEERKMQEMIDKYLIGTIVRLYDDDPEDEREVVGYKQIRGTNYLLFKDGSMAYVGRVKHESISM